MAGPGKNARGLLKGHWAPACLTQLVWLCGVVLLLLVETLVLRLWRVDMAGHMADMLHPARGYLSPYAAVLLAMLLLDLLLLSPLRLGKIRYYARLLTGEDTVRELFFFYRGKRYFTALWWRLRLWLRAVGWGALFFLPGALSLGLSALVRAGTLADVTGMLVLCLNVIGGLSLLSGFVALCLWLLRYQPASLMLADGEPSKGLFRRSCRSMKGRVGELAWLYLRLSGWALCEWLIVPGFYAGPLLATARVRFLRRAVKNLEAERTGETPPRRRRLSRRAAVT